MDELIESHFPPVLSLPGEGMTIKRIPLPDDLIRLEALKAAVESSGRGDPSSSILRRAQEFETYIREGGSEPSVYHDENTLSRVHDALRENGYLPDDIPGVISSFQNRGILFRERR